MERKLKPSAASLRLPNKICELFHLAFLLPRWACCVAYLFITATAHAVKVQMLQMIWPRWAGAGRSSCGRCSLSSRTADSCCKCQRQQFQTQRTSSVSSDKWLPVICPCGRGRGGAGGARLCCQLTAPARNKSCHKAHGGSCCHGNKRQAL